MERLHKKRKGKHGSVKKDYYTVVNVKCKQMEDTLFIIANEIKCLIHKYSNKDLHPTYRTDLINERWYWQREFGDVLKMCKL